MLTAAAAGQVVTVFRSRLRADAGEAYESTAATMLATARQVPGFVDFASFTAEDGERVSIVTFASWQAQQAWREHPLHREAQRRGRDEFYAEYSIQVGECLRVELFPAVALGGEDDPGGGIAGRGHDSSAGVAAE